MSAQAFLALKKTNYMKQCFTLIWVACFSSLLAVAQYAPPAGEPGSAAIHKDSSVFDGWADSCRIIRGYIDVSDTTATTNGDNRASYGLPEYGTGKANNKVVSLGDHGQAILTFESPIRNGEGPDFAVFENSLDDTFLELAFVEVSSDGENFYRFDAVSLTQTKSQIGGFGEVDATEVHNLAGKYRRYYGTPFDLNELKDTTGLNVNRITHIRLVDVIGTIKNRYATYDSKGNKVNDPWPTDFYSCGFDLDAVGVIHFADESGVKSLINEKPIFQVSPNPVSNVLTINEQANGLNGSARITRLQITTLQGELILRKKEVTLPETLNVNMMKPGLYILQVKTQRKSYTKKLIKQ